MQLRVWVDFKNHNSATEIAELPGRNAMQEITAEFCICSKEIIQVQHEVELTFQI